MTDPASDLVVPVGTSYETPIEVCKEIDRIADFLRWEYPGISFSCGNTYDSINFTTNEDGTPATKPSREEFDSRYSFYCSSGRAFQKLRKERDTKLKKTDFLATQDFPFPSNEIRTAWHTYRQQLRDLPISHTAHLNSDDELVVDWPKPPLWPANVV